MDSGHENHEINLRKEIINAENVESLFKKYDVPFEFDLLSIDIDSNDYYVWGAIRNYSPRIVVIEYNANVPPDQSRTIPYTPNFVFPHTDYFGASLLALKKLGDEKGYTLVSCDNLGVNAFFVRSDLVNFAIRNIEEIYRRPRFFGIFGHGWENDERKLVPV